MGNDCFQFRFQDERDMRTVLANRPYQYGHWMIILQQWEPIISPSFPSQIPFWISLKGIPLHFWDEKTIRDIGQELGELEDYILTKTTARVRVMMDGLKPLPQESVLEFSSGEECIIALEYEKLENFCTNCLKLSHFERNCTEKLPSEANDNLKKENSIYSVDGPQRTHQPAKHQYSQHQRMERSPPPPRYQREATAFHQRVDRHGNPFGERATIYQSRALPLRNKITPALDRETTECPHQIRRPTHRIEVSETSPQYSTRRTEPSRGHLNQSHRSPIELPEGHLNQKCKSPLKQQWQIMPQHTAESSKKESGPDQSRPPLERNLDKEDFPHLKLPYPHHHDQLKKSWKS